MQRQCQKCSRDVPSQALFCPICGENQSTAGSFESVRPRTAARVTPSLPALAERVVVAREAVKKAKYDKRQSYLVAGFWTIFLGLIFITCSILLAIDQTIGLADAPGQQWGFIIPVSLSGTGLLVILVGCKFFVRHYRRLVAAAEEEATFCQELLMGALPQEQESSGVEARSMTEHRRA